MQIAKGRLSWSDSYIIVRLQTEKSHKFTQEPLKRAKKRSVSFKHRPADQTGGQPGNEHRRHNPHSADADTGKRGRKGGKEDRTYEIPDAVKFAKPAPPCKEYQHGKCSHNACHVYRGAIAVFTFAIIASLTSALSYHTHFTNIKLKSSMRQRRAGQGHGGLGAISTRKGRKIPGYPNRRVSWASRSWLTER